jgi:hypothetical protein
VTPYQEKRHLYSVMRKETMILIVMYQLVGFFFSCVVCTLESRYPKLSDFIFNCHQDLVSLHKNRNYSKRGSGSPLSLQQNT